MSVSKIDDSDKNFVILNHCWDDGLGDHASGYKMAKLISKKMGIAPSHVYIATNDKKGAALFNANGKFPMIDLEDVGKVQNVALQIMIPHKCVFSFSTPNLFLHEYGCTRAGDKEFQGSPVGDELMRKGVRIIEKMPGLGAKEEGIFIDESMAKYSFSSQTDDLAHRQRLLEKLSSPIKEGILGAGTDQANFMTRSKLYVGRGGTDACLSFIKAICEINRANDQDLVFVLPHKTHLFDAAKKSLSAYGISKIEFTDLNAQTTTFFELQQAKFFGQRRGKTVKIISGSTPTSDFRRIWMAAEKEVLATGDHSLSDCFAGNKSFAYETCLHKTENAAALKQLYSFNPPAVKTRSDSTKIMVKIFKKNQQDNYLKVTYINQKICMEKNIWERIKPSIDELLTTAPVA